MVVVVLFLEVMLHDFLVYLCVVYVSLSWVAKKHFLNILPADIVIISYDKNKGFAFWDF